MKVSLAGYNLDLEVIRKWQRLAESPVTDSSDAKALAAELTALAGEPLTPETLTAAYARISRSDKMVAELRREARGSVARARRSNERIVFGLGHASVAEHSVFNLDITDTSRLSLEELEAHRLASYTEASQRYIRMGGDYIVPQEISDLGVAGEFAATCDKLFEGYRKLITLLEEYHKELPERERSSRSCEDARYILPLACRSQVGVTVNARTAEWMIRTFQQSALDEVRVMGALMLDELKRVVPSLMRYTAPRPEVASTEDETRALAVELTAGTAGSRGEEVSLIDHPRGDARLALAAMLFRMGKGPFNDCLAVVDALTPERRRDLLLTAHRFLGPHDPLLREMELGNFTFAVTLSASAFAQLKRHRLATIIKQPYDPLLGVTLPPDVRKVGAVDLFMEYIKAADDMYSILKDKSPVAAPYILTNAHRRRVIFQASARELTHLSRLREDRHAQWDIRSIAKEMLNQARTVCPELMAFTAGKDSFDDMHRRTFGNDEGKPEQAD